MEVVTKGSILAANAADAAAKISCLSCGKERAPRDVVSVRPCWCSFCKDCFVQFLADTRLRQPLRCCHCDATVSSHRIHKADDDATVTEHSYDANGDRSGSDRSARPTTQTAAPTSDATHSEVTGTAAAASASTSNSEDPPPKQQKRKKKSANLSKAGAERSPSKKKRKRKTTGKLLFEERLNELRAFQEKNGNCDVPNDGSHLACWIKEVRQLGQRISEDKRSQLDDLGFNWNLNDDVGDAANQVVKRKPRKTFDTRIQDLLAFKEEHGHCRVPYRYAPDLSLGQWISDVRRGAQKVSRQQRLLLNGLGFNWETRANRFDRQWKEHLERLKTYHERHGAYGRSPPIAYDKQLYEWCNTQRKLHNKGQLQENRTKALEEIGFVWSHSGSHRDF